MSVPRSRPSPLGRGFPDPVMDAQRSFRALMSAMAEPGTLHRLDAEVAPPSSLAPAAAIALLVLADHDTPVWLAPEFADAVPFIGFHAEAAIARTHADARFAVIMGASPAPVLADFDRGEDRYPDRSATVIVVCEALEGGEITRLSGPGIRGTRDVAPRGLRAGFWAEVERNGASYPLGVDILLVAGREIMGLPRSVRISRRQRAEGR